jgi:hypothetical protein
MKPLPMANTQSEQRLIGNLEQGYIVYSPSDQPMKIDLQKSSGTFIARWIDPADGRVLKEEKKIKAGKILELKGIQPGANVLWLSRK